MQEEEVEYSEDEFIKRRLEELERRKRQVCLRKANIAGLMLTAGDIIKVRVKGFSREEIEAVFICYNSVYSWVRLRLDDSEMIVKLSEIRYIRKIKKEDREQSDDNR